MQKSNYRHFNKFSKVNLTTLMSLYYNNFININSLIDLFSIQKITTLYSKSSDIPILIELLDQATYTTTLRLNYLFKDSDKIPDLQVRIYHDSRQAEVLQVKSNDKNISLFTLTRYDNYSNIEARWYLNNFLHKWLQHCSKHKYLQI